MRNTHKRTHKNNRLRHIAADYQPLYLNAMEYSRNIKWNNDKDGSGGSTTIGVWFIIRYHNSYSIMSTGHSINYNISTENYNAWIMILFDIINFGIIRPQTERDIRGK